MDPITIRDLLTGGTYGPQFGGKFDPKILQTLTDGSPPDASSDLQSTLQYIDTAYDFVRRTVADGGVILFVGTAKLQDSLIVEQAIRVGQPWVVSDWPVGLLSEIVARSAALVDNVEEGKRGAADTDVTAHGHEQLAHPHDGWQWRTRPAALWVTGGPEEAAVVDEARRLGIPVVGISSTGEDSHRFDYSIPGTTASSDSDRVLTRIVADAVKEGHDLRHTRHWWADDEDTVSETGVWSQRRVVHRRDRANRRGEQQPMSWLDHVVDIDRSPIVQLFSTNASLTPSVETLLVDQLGVRFWTKNDPDEWVIGSAVVGNDTDTPAVVRVTRGEQDSEGFTIELVDPSGDSSSRAEVLRRFGAVFAKLALWSLRDAT